MVTILADFLKNDCPKSILKVLEDAEAVYMGPEKLYEKYCGETNIWLDNPIPWTHGVHGVLSADELKPALYRQIIQELRERFKGMRPKSYNDAVKRLTGVSGSSQENERRNTYFDEIVMAENFPGKTEDEIIILYIVDAMKLCDKCCSVIRRLEKLIKDAES